MYPRNGSTEERASIPLLVVSQQLVTVSMPVKTQDFFVDSRAPDSIYLRHYNGFTQVQECRGAGQQSHE